MKSEKFFVLTLALMFAVFFAGGVSAQPTNSTNYTVTTSGLQVQSIKYTPYPVNPGEYFDIWIQADIPTSMNYARFELQQDFPFSLDNSSQTTYTYKNDGGRSVVMHYKVRVSQNAVEGVNELKLAMYTSPLETNAVVKNFDIYVSNVQTDFALVVQDSSSSQVSLAIANIGENTANSMIVKIPQQSGFRLTGTNGQMIGNLDAGDYSIASFNILPTGRDSSTLKVEIDYTDSIGVRRTVYENVTFFQGATGSFNSTVIGQGNRTFNGRQFTGTGNFAYRNQSSSIFQEWWFWLIIIVVLGGGFYLYKNPEQRGKIFSKFKSIGKREKTVEKDLKKVPEWVSSERKKH